MAFYLARQQMLLSNLFMTFFFCVAPSCCHCCLNAARHICQLGIVRQCVAQKSQPIQAFPPQIESVFYHFL